MLTRDDLSDPEVFLRLVITPCCVWTAKVADEPLINTQARRGLLLAIAIHESGLVHERQLGGGPGRSHWQHEGNEASGLAHLVRKAFRADSGRLGRLRLALDLVGLDPAPATELGERVALSPVAACVAAIGLLYADPEHLPPWNRPDLGWRCYLRNWRPGRQRPEDWQRDYAQASLAVAAAG